MSAFISIRVGANSSASYYKDGISEFLTQGTRVKTEHGAAHERGPLNPDKKGTKAAFHYCAKNIKGERTLRLRLTTKELDDPFAGFKDVFEQRIKEADDFYKALVPPFEERWLKPSGLKQYPRLRNKGIPICRAPR